MTCKVCDGTGELVDTEDNKWPCYACNKDPILTHVWNADRECYRCHTPQREALGRTLQPDTCPGYLEPVCTTCDPGISGRCVDCGRLPIEADEERAKLMSVVHENGRLVPSYDGDQTVISRRYPRMEVVPDVDEFHERMGLHREAEPLLDKDAAELADLANALHSLSADMLRESDGTGILKDRVALMLEELAEIVTGFVHNDREEIIDGNADLVYLCLGNAALFKVRLLEAVRRVHASNMSKTPGQPKPFKGEGYFKPNFEGL